jgi:hypothetical protein
MLGQRARDPKGLHNHLGAYYKRAWDEQMAPRAGGAHYSGTPALRSPTKYVASYRARIFGTPKYPKDLRRAILE